MRLARPSAFIFALFMAGLISAAVWHLTPEVATERQAVNGPVAAVRYASAARFRCDSLFAKDCFEMFHRHSTGPVTTVPFMPTLDRGALSATARTETDACLSDVPHRGDRCLMREHR